jgi:transcriptional regulator with XRE-family HTH domain
MDNSKRITELEAEIKRLKKQGRTKREPVAGIGGVVQMHREACNMGLQELAIKAGIPAGGLSGIEQGQRNNPTWATIKGLAKGLGITAAKLVAAFEAAESSTLSRKRKEARK